MLAVERRRLIAENLRTRGVVSVAEMAGLLTTTEITVRRDLRAMAKDGLLVRAHGGAVLPATIGHEPSYSEKAHQAGAEKASIAQLAVKMIFPGDSILLGPGTTTLALARLLGEIPELTVVTNSLLVAQALMTSRMRPEEQGQLQGANSSLTAIAGIFGPIAFTHVFSALIGPLPGAPFLLAAALMLASCAIAWAATRPR